VYPPGDPESHATRYEILRDQLEIYTRYGVSWAIWTYKYIGLQGVVYASPDSPWVERIRPVLQKKARLGVDACRREEPRAARSQRSEERQTWACS
jgi:endoglucanase